MLCKFLWILLASQAPVILRAAIIVGLLFTEEYFVATFTRAVYIFFFTASRTQVSLQVSLRNWAVQFWTLIYSDAFVQSLFKWWELIEMDHLFAKGTLVAFELCMFLDIICTKELPTVIRSYWRDASLTHWRSSFYYTSEWSTCSYTVGLLHHLSLSLLLF